MSNLDLLKPALAVQLGHLLLSCLWNLTGVYLIQHGQQALGPTASLTTSALLIFFAILLILGATKYPKLYLGISVIVMAGALSAILPAFHEDPGLWPSDFWRFSGVVLNGFGVAGAVLGIMIWRKKC